MTIISTKNIPLLYVLYTNYKISVYYYYATKHMSLQI